ncbi:hypothetical protein CSAL01_03515 [Colletotrichum salicis]|uniref:Uncharacterized protein n=1 Tax=Colletotrichum salicis TaxID=1209931 RepID=A0A135UG98_9PEZI|nr:hypothetical protein CSAL01_03515 [Colletotrichum salicis]
MSLPGILAQDFPNTQKRTGYIKTKFAGLIQDDSALPKILEKARQSVKEELSNDKIDENGVSEYWHKLGYRLCCLAHVHGESRPEQARDLLLGTQNPSIQAPEPLRHRCLVHTA